MRPFLLLVFLLVNTVSALAEPITRAEMEAFVQPPFKLGAQINEKGVFDIVNVHDEPAGYIFETQELAPLPGFSGAPINLVVTLDRQLLPSPARRGVIENRVAAQDC